jgi:hypothetical protein
MTSSIGNNPPPLTPVPNSSIVPLNQQQAFKDLVQAFSDNNASATGILSMSEVFTTTHDVQRLFQQLIYANFTADGLQRSRYFSAGTAVASAIRGFLETSNVTYKRDKSINAQLKTLNDNLNQATNTLNGQINTYNNSLNGTGTGSIFQLQLTYNNYANALNTLRQQFTAGFKDDAARNAAIDVYNAAAGAYNVQAQAYNGKIGQLQTDIVNYDHQSTPSSVDVYNAGITALNATLASQTPPGTPLPFTDIVYWPPQLGETLAPGFALQLLLLMLA